MSSDQEKRPQQRMTRRDFLNAAGLATAGMVLATPTPMPAAAATPAIKRGGTHTRGDWINVITLDVHKSAEDVPLFLGLYNYLFSYRLVDPTTYRHELKGELVETWQKPDSTTFIFKLRKGVKFHDGSDWNAEVAKWNLERLKTHPKSQGKATLADVQGVDILDSSTIRLKLKEPSAPLLVSLSPGLGLFTMGMVSKAAVEKMGEDAFASNPVGSGPFRFESWVRDDRVILKRFEGYWEMGDDGKPLPYFDRLVTRYAEAPQLMLMLRAGEIEAMRTLAPEDIATAKADPTLVYDHPKYFLKLEPTIEFNGKIGVFAQNLKLRQAALYALDLKAMADALGFGTAKPHPYPYWAPGNLGWDESIKRYDYDPQKAKQLMGEAGHPKGVDIVLMIMGRPQYLREAEMLKSMWDAVGFRTKVEPLERAAFNERGVTGKGYDAMFFAPMTFADPDFFFSRYVKCGAPGNRSSHCSKEFDQCMAEGKAEYDVTKRDKIYRRCLTILQEEAFHFGGFALPGDVAYKKYVKGYRMQWGMADPRAVWLDK